MSKLPHGGVDRDVAQIPFHRVHHGRGDRGVVVAGPWRGGEPGRGLNPTPGREIGKPVKTQSKTPIESKSLNERTTVEIRRSAISRGKHAARLYMDSAAASAQNSENGGKRARKWWGTSQKGTCFGARVEPGERGGVGLHDRERDLK